jgi:hypothetical protein
LRSEISSLSVAIPVFRKARSHREPNLGCRGLTDLGDAMFYKKSNSCATAARMYLGPNKISQEFLEVFPYNFV